MVLGLNTNLFILFFIRTNITIKIFHFPFIQIIFVYIKTTLIICTWNAIKFSHFLYNVFFFCSIFLTFLLILFVHSYTISQIWWWWWYCTIAQSKKFKKIFGVLSLHLRARHKQNMNRTILSLNVFKSVIKCLLYMRIVAFASCEIKSTHTYKRICDHKYNESHYRTIFQL